MKSSPERTEDLISNTSEYKKSKIKENNRSFNHLEKFATDHNVIVTNTMIKITYNKAFKEQNTFDGDIDFPMESNFTEKKNKLANRDTSYLGKPPGKPVFHSTPKPTETEKKKYLNGLSLVVGQNNQKGKKNCSSSKVQKPSQVSDDVPNSDKRFLKSDDSLRSKDSISRKTSVEKKTKKSDKKLKNGLKKKEGQVSGVKRKLSNTEVNILSKNKKVKISNSEGKEVNECTEDKTKGKKQIMLVDPDLPAGWSRFVKTRNEGSESEQHFVYIVNPQGKKFRYKWKLRQYLNKINSTLDVDQFFFGLYPRLRTPSSLKVLEGEKNCFEEHDLHSDSINKRKKQDEPSNDAKKFLLFDPDLPLGWKRIIHSSAISGKKKVHIVSPDGKIFKKRSLLNEYLIKNHSNHSLDKFYFGLYPKKEKNIENLKKESKEKTSNSVKFNLIPPSAMLEDPKLPEGWKRFIKIRTYGESAGRMEVVIISPDGRRHRTKKRLKNYLLEQKLNYEIDDFDFTVFGKADTKKQLQKSSQKEPTPETCSALSTKKRFVEKLVPELDIDALKDDIITSENHMINTVSGLMMCSGLTSARNERRQRRFKGKHENDLETHLNCEDDESCDGCEIPTFWIKKLVKCRADFRSLESDAASTIAETAKKFIKTLSLLAFSNSEEPEAELKYEHLAEVVNATECLSFLKILIPKKITYREYIKLNRPKQYMSFT